MTQARQSADAQKAAERARFRRLGWLMAAGMVLVIASLGYREFWLRRPIGTGPAGPAVSREAFAAKWTERPVLLLGIGDSITAGLGADSPDRSYFRRLETSPRDDVAEMQAICLSTVLPNLKTLNVARSGSNSLQHLEIVRDLETQPNDVLGLVVMTTGGNDLIHDYGRNPPREGAMYGATLDEAQPWIENFRSRLNAMLDSVEEKFPGGCHIFLADIYDPTDGVGDAPSVFLPHWRDGLAIHADYNRVIHECAQQRDNIHLVPLHAEFLGHGSHCRQFWRQHYRSDDPHYWFHDNVEDPNDRGYDAIRRLFLIEMINVREAF